MRIFWEPLNEILSIKRRKIGDIQNLVWVIIHGDQALWESIPEDNGSFWEVGDAPSAKPTARNESRGHVRGYLADYPIDKYD